MAEYSWNAIMMTYQSLLPLLWGSKSNKSIFAWLQMCYRCEDTELLAELGKSTLSVLGSRVKWRTWVGKDHISIPGEYKAKAEVFKYTKSVSLHRTEDVLITIEISHRCISSYRALPFKNIYIKKKNTITLDIFLHYKHHILCNTPTLALKWLII